MNLCKELSDQEQYDGENYNSVLRQSMALSGGSQFVLKLFRAQYKNY